MKKILLIIITFLSVQTLQSQKVYDFSITCQQAYKNICELKIKNAESLIQLAKQQNVNNLIPIYLESYIDIIELFFNEDINEYKERKDKIDDRIALLKKGNENSALYLFCLSNAYLHKSVLHVRYGENMSSAWAARKAYMLIKENKEAFENFAPNNMIFGSLQAITGTIPKSYNWIASILGMKGSLTEGIKNLSSFVNSNDPWAKLFNTESSFLFCYLNYYINNKQDETIQFIQSGKFDLVNNHLFAYTAANLGINAKQTEFAKNVIINKNKSSDYLQTNVWDMQMGFIKLHQLEFTEAIHYFNIYLKNFKGNFYLKDVYQKLSWAYYLQENYKAAQEARNAVLTKGNTNSDADKQALKDAKAPQWPNVILLKSRLLNDGGYNTEALNLLQNYSINSFNKDEEKLEFVYRLARIYDDINNDALAIKYYNQTIVLGKFRKEYYAARAALQIGMIYEKLKNNKEAVAFYNQCLNMDHHDYKNSLDQRAKSGIARCQGE